MKSPNNIQNKVLFVLFMVGSVFHFKAEAQILKPVKWSFSYQKGVNNNGKVLLTATIEKGWHIYAQDIGSGEGPIPTSFTFQKSKAYTLVGKVKPDHAPKILFDPTFKKNIGFHELKVVFKQNVRIVSGVDAISGNLEFMVCNDRQCLPPETVDFKVNTK